MENKKKKIRNIKEDIPVAKYDKKQGCFQCGDKRYVDVYLIIPKDLVNGDPEMIEMDCFTWAKFYKVYGMDIEIVCMKFPCDTHHQQEYWREVLERNENPVYEPMIKRKIAELEYREKNTEKKEFFLVCFYENLEELAAGRKTIDSTLGIRRQNKMGTGLFELVEEIPEKKKRQVLFKFFNKNAHIF